MTTKIQSYTFMATAVLKFREKPREITMMKYIFICVFFSGSHTNMTENRFHSRPDWFSNWKFYFHFFGALKRLICMESQIPISSRRLFNFNFCQISILLLPVLQATDKKRIFHETIYKKLFFTAISKKWIR